MRVGVGMIALFGALAIAGVARAGGPVVESVQVRGRGGSAEVAIHGAFAVPRYAARVTEEGRVVVIDVAGVALPEAGVEATGEAPMVRAARVTATPRGSRIEIELDRPAPYRVRAADGRIVVRVNASSEGSSEEAAADDSGAPLAVRSVAVEPSNGRERVVVHLTGSAEFRVIRGSDGSSRLVIRGAQVPASVGERIAIPTGSLIRDIHVRAEAGTAVVEVTSNGGASGTAIRAGSRIIWMFAPESRHAGRPRARTITTEEGFAPEEGETTEVAAFLSDVPLQVSGARGGRRWSGRRIDLDFKDADIHNILRLLAEVGNVNIVTADNVSGQVTIRMRNVPWDQALDVILQAKGLGMVRTNNLIRVAPLTTLEAEREAAIARRKQQVQLAPLETRLVPVSYAQASDLSPRVRELLTERGTVSVDARTNVLIVRDVVDQLDDVEELVRTLDTQTPQVLIEARIVEATSRYTRDVGIQWGGDGSMTSTNGNPTGLAFPYNWAVAGGATDNNAPLQGLTPFAGTTPNPNFAVNLPAAVGTNSGGALGLTLGSVGGNVNLSVRLSAAEANGVVRIISSPRILTLDNHEASISQGTLIPYSQVSAQGVNTAFQEAKLELKVRPHVTSDGSVSMHVNITRDEPDFNNTGARGDPTILKREAQTDLLVPDGHTAVIGGIYTRNTGRSVDQVPFFGDIPVLGVLFQRRRVSDTRNELLIFLTPRIVNRAEALIQ